jgi:hypothetical protein
MITAKELIENTSHLNFLNNNEKILVEAIMEAYKELTLENEKRRLNNSICNCQNFTSEFELEDGTILCCRCEKEKE